jgi:sulfite exporter TauE/SafE
MDTYLPQYLQLFGLGIFWISVHCAGMCGPIMAGLTASSANHSDPPLQRALHAARRVLAYQLGRALTYAALGATAGLLGHAIEDTLHGFASVAGLLVAAALILAGLAQVPIIKRKIPWITSARDAGAGRAIGAALRAVNKRWPKALPGRMLAIGALMGLLPCLLMFWVLSLSASTASPLHGALIMALLVALTTPVLLVAGCGPLLASPALRRRGQQLIPAAICLSGIWLGLISAAANGWIEHQHLNFSLAGQHYHMMFW